MTFAWPDLLWLLLALPALVLLYLWLLRRRRKNTVRFASLGLVKAALGKGPGWRRHVPPVLLLLALAQVDRAELTDRLAGVGRTSARSRVAALLIEIRNQRRRANPALGPSFALGLTQEEIGDATGLTAKRRASPWPSVIHAPWPRSAK